MDRQDIWTSHDGRRTRICDLDDVHLANLIGWVADRIERYPPDLLVILILEAEERGLPDAFLERAEIPWKDADGDWCLDCRKLKRTQ